MRDYLEKLSYVIQDNWESPALIDYSTLIGEQGVNYTYGQLYGAMVALCNRFNELGIQEGDHIAICGANSASWIVAYLAIARYHAVSVMIMHSLSSQAIAQMVNYSDSVAIIADKEIIETLPVAQMPKVKHLMAMENLPKPEVVRKDNILLKIKDENALASICFTSGSEGMPKGVMISYKGVYLGIFGIAENLPVRENKNIVSFAPLAHILGIGSEVLTPLCQGSHIYFAGSVLTIELVFECLLRIRPYRVLMFPMVLNKLVGSANIQLLKQLSFIECCLTGGAKIAKEVEMVCQQFHFPLTMGYGLTETSGLISLTDPALYKMGSVGKPIDAMETVISSEGEILVRGENVMLGYYKDPEATAAKIDKDGWLHTGDRGYLDEERFLYVEGRLEQDMIVLPSGENIHPENIESILNNATDVEESLVVTRNGKLIALVRIKGETSIEKRNAILAMVNPQLPSYAQLFGIEFISEPLARTEKRTIKRYLYT